MVQPRKFVAGPTAVALPFGLQSVSLISDDNDPHGGFGIEFQSTNCGIARRSIGACFDDQNDDPDDPTPDDGVPVIESSDFGVYSLHTCRNLGGGNTNGEQRARDNLRVGEWRAIEEGFEALVLEASAEDITPTPGTPVTRIEALGRLERFARANYGSQPIIHMDALTATQLAAAGAIDRYGTRMETKIGSAVAVGAGYTPAGAVVDGTTAGAGESWLYATGGIVVHRGAIVTSPMTQEMIAGEYSNEFAVLAQRAVSVAVECLVAAIMVAEAQ